MGYEGSWKKPSSFHAEPFTRALIYSIHGRQDLPAADLEHTTLFQLFGRISPAADYVLTERDQLEFMRMLQRHDKRPHHLFDLMRGRHLLLLGCGFSDWLARFFLELVTNIWAPGKRLAKTLVDAAQAGDPGLVFFLGECGVEVCKDVSAADFAIELSRRWLERHPDGQPTGRAVIAWDGAQEDAEGEAPVSRVYDKNRVMFYTFLYSRWGEDNVWCGRFLTPEGYPSVSGQCAAEYVEKTWDAQGNLIQERYLDGTGMPAPAIPGYFGGRWRWDANGNELEHVYLDDQGRPTATGDGIASVRFQRDEKGRSIRTTYTDCLGRPCCHGGVGAIESEYDRYGRTIRSSYFDFQGRPAARIDNGIQTMKWEHDDHGNEVSAACFDKDGQPTMETNDRFHMIRKVYNERDQVVRQAFFDTQGRPALNKRLYHGQNITPRRAEQTPSHPVLRRGRETHGRPGWLWRNSPALRPMGRLGGGGLFRRRRKSY